MIKKRSCQPQPVRLFTQTVQSASSRLLLRIDLPFPKCQGPQGKKRSESPRSEFILHVRVVSKQKRPFRTSKSTVTTHKLQHLYRPNLSPLMSSKKEDVGTSVSSGGVTVTFNRSRIQTNPQTQIEGPTPTRDSVTEYQPCESSLTIRVFVEKQKHGISTRQVFY